MKYFNNFLSYPYSISDRNSSIFRLLFCVNYVFFGWFKSYKEYAEIPSFFYVPPSISISSFTTSFPSTFFFIIVQCCIFAAFLCVFIGYNTRIASFLFSLLTIILYSFKYSLGKIDHDFIPIALPAFMAFTNWGNYYSIDSLKLRKKVINPKYAISVFTMGLSTAYLVAGLYKIKGNWLSWSYQSVYSIIIQRQGPIFDFIPIQFFEILDWLIIAFELSFIIFYPIPKYFKYTVIFAMFFHLSVSIFLKIHFLTFPIIYFIYLLSDIKDIKINLKPKRFAKPIIIITLLIFTFLCYQTFKFDESFYSKSIGKFLILNFTNFTVNQIAPIIHLIFISIAFGIYYYGYKHKKRT